MFWENIQAVLAVYWPVPTGLLLLLFMAAFNFYRLRRTASSTAAEEIAAPDIERLAHRAQA